MTKKKKKKNKNSLIIVCCNQDNSQYLERKVTYKVYRQKNVYWRLKKKDQYLVICDYWTMHSSFK